MKKNKFKNLFKGEKFKHIFPREKKEIVETNFIPLYPNYNSNNEIYVKRLEEALKDERILNIGVTGPYGSGKSSVLLGLVNKLPDKTKCITVSLATFGSKKKIDNNKTKIKVQTVNGNEVEQSTDNSEEINITDNNGDGKRDIKDLEIGILQQIIYKVNPKKIPLSKIVRIKEDSEVLFRIIITIILYVLNFSILKNINTYFFEFLKNIPKFETYLSSNFISITIHAILFILIYNALGVILRKFNITSISFKGVDLVSESKSESILNKYIDEIIYILQKSKFNIIIFEDIDRFDEEEIFIKLRELNKIINDNEIISKNGKVRFIYAVRDDILSKAEERTKFFDIIIPIIPIISNNNAQLKFIENLEIIGLKNIVSENIIQEVSYFVDDMRMVINICNEFKIYYEKIYETLSSKDNYYSVDQLFAIIAYKNINPKDFQKMQYDKGHINELINYKKYVYKLVEKKIKELENKNESILKKNEEEERRIKSDIIRRYDFSVGTKNDGYYVGRQFYKNLEIFMEDAILENIFERGLRGENEDRSKRISEIYPKNTWREKYYNFIELNNNIIARNNVEIKKLQGRLKQNEFLKDILEKDRECFVKIYEEKDFLNDKEKSVMKEILDNKILMKFIREGYITEEYRYYINNIYLKNLTIDEYNFIVSVKSGNNSKNYTIRLPNIKIVNSRLSKSDFGNQEILNYDLLKYLFERRKRNLPKESKDLDIKIFFMGNHIKKNIEKDGDFIFYFIDKVEDKKYFLNKIIEYTHDIWGTISKYATPEKRERYIEYFLKYLDSDGIKKVDIYSKFKCDLEKLEYIDMENVKKIYSVYKDFKFKNISNFEIKILEFVVNKKIYEININNINAILLNYLKNEYNNKYTDNFLKIMQIPKEEIRSYINENIDDFLGNVLKHSKLIINLFELNKIIDCEPSIEKLDTILGNVLDYSIKYITDIRDSRYWNFLLKRKKIYISIDNILIYYNKLGISRELIYTLNSDENFNQIMEDIYQYNIYQLIENGFENLLNEICRNDDLLLSRIEELIKIYKDKTNKKLCLEFEIISNERLIFFINRDFVSFNPQNYEIVKERIPNFLLEFCLKNIDDFIKNYNILNVDEDFKNRLMKSNLREIHRIRLKELFNSNDMYVF